MLSAINIMLVIASRTSIAVEGFASTSPARAPIRQAMLYNAISTFAASATDEDTIIPAITEKFQNITSVPNIAIVIDVENVRGKTSFELDHADLLDRLLIWTKRRGYAFGRTIVVIDHGSKRSAHLLHRHTDEETALCVTFAGPGQVNADDIIARDVRWLLSSSSDIQHIVVVTADKELAWRCRSATNEDVSGYNSMRNLASTCSSFDNKGGDRKKTSKMGRKKSRAARKRQYLQAVEEPGSDEAANDDDTDEQITSSNNSADDERLQEEQPSQTVEVIAPQRFLEDLEQASFEWLHEQQQLDNQIMEQGSSDSSAVLIPSPIGTLQTLFALRGEILTIESQLRKRCTLHKRQTLTGELRLRKKEWRKVLAYLTNDVTDSCDSGQSSLACTLAWSLSATIINSSNDDDNDGMPVSPVKSATPSAWDKLASNEQEELLKRWGKKRGRVGSKREKTEDRIVMAERLRRQLELLVPSDSSTLNGDKDKNLASIYAEYINAYT